MTRRKDDPELVDELIVAGMMCANCCYNLSGNRTYTLPEDVIRSMRESQEQFDTARRALWDSRKQ